MSYNPLLDAFSRELADASPDLIDNADLLRGVLAACGDCIKVLDLEGRLLFMSEGGKRVMEVDDFSALKGCLWPDLWTGEGKAQVELAIAEAKAGRTMRFSNLANTAKGTPRYWEVQVSPILGSDGKPSHLLSISRDITEEWKGLAAKNEYEARMKFFAKEIRRRIKNSLASAAVMANQTFPDAGEDQWKRFEAHMQALSDSYDDLTG